MFPARAGVDRLSVCLSIAGAVRTVTAVRLIRRRAPRLRRSRYATTCTASANGMSAVTAHAVDMMRVRDVPCNLHSSMQQLEQHDRLRDEVPQIVVSQRSAHGGGRQRLPHGHFSRGLEREGGWGYGSLTLTRGSDAL